jgi:hypothetical protein
MATEIFISFIKDILFVDYGKPSHRLPVDKKHLPLELLEQSVACCLALGLEKYIEKNGLKNNPFGSIIVSICGEELHIRSDIADEKVANVFKGICDNCYITQHLTFKKKIIYKNLK